ncbi:hypothetical protein [Neobacillus dielmonensis]|uniref:hypothetical protein n=1 Tax=Neobacillus dielmonensis TaxID=1347369 RepID=UPI0005A637D1|nr:hypothetical protein [Neobacillus dielmonensis]
MSKKPGDSPGFLLCKEKFYGLTCSVRQNDWVTGTFHRFTGQVHKFTGTIWGNTGVSLALINRSALFTGTFKAEP